ALHDQSGREQATVGGGVFDDLVPGGVCGQFERLDVHRAAVERDRQPEVPRRLIGEIGHFGEDFVADRVDGAAADLEAGDADVAGPLADGDERRVIVGEFRAGGAAIGDDD